MIPLLRLLFILWICKLCASKNLIISYNYANEDSQLSDNLEIFANKISNDNRFWATKFHSSKSESSPSITISSGDVEIREPIPSELPTDISKYMLQLVAKFSSEYYKSNILKPPQKYGADTFNSLEYSHLEITQSSEFTKFLAKNLRYAYVLFYRKDSFEHLEYLLKFESAIRDTSLNGALIDCETNPELCESYSITSEPKLIAFENEEIYKVHDSRFNTIHDWMLTLQQPFITKLLESDVPKYRSGIVPGFSEPRDTVTMLFTDTKKSQVYRDLVRFARENHGKYHLLALVNKDVAQWAHYPAFVTMKPYDPFIKAFTLYMDITYQRMVKYIEESVRPNIHSIKSAQDFFYATSTDTPLIILYDPLKSQDSENFHKLASNHQIGSPRDAFFGTIDALNIFSFYLSNLFDVYEASYIIIKKEGSSYYYSMNKFEKLSDSQILNLIKNQDFIELKEAELKQIEKLERVEEVEQLRYNLKTIHDEL